MTITSESLVARAPAVAFVDHGDRVVALPLESSQCVPLEIDGGGVFVWHALRASPEPILALVEKVARQVDSDPADLEPSILLFIEQLVHSGLVTLRR